MAQRRFELVGYGESAPPGAICCDGLVPGAALDVSHWRGNKTPAAMKADTSTEMALGCARRGLDPGLELVVNNHFDTDGVLSVWALLEPERALAHAALLVAAAEVGDFDEWPDDERGLRLEAAIRALSDPDDDAESYRRVLPHIGELVANLEARSDVWGPAWAELLEADRAAEEGALAVSSTGPVVVLVHAEGLEELPGPVLHKRVPQGITRWLVAFEEEEGWRYRYELARWAWAETVRRPAVASVGSARAVAALGEGWEPKGGGMTAVAYTPGPIATDPDEVAAAIAKLEG